MNQNVILTFIAVMTLLIWGFVAAMVYDMEGSLGGEEDEKTEDDTDGSDSDTSEKYYLKVPGVDGDAAAKGHDKWVHVYSYSQGIISSGPGINKTSSPRHITQPFVVTKMIDKSSPKLLQYMIDGTRFNATLDVLRYDPAVEDRVLYYQWVLVNAKVDSITSDIEPVFGGSDQSDRPPEESVSFSFGKIEWTSPKENFTIEMQGNFPLDDEPVDGDDDDDIVILYPEHNPLTLDGGKLDDMIHLRSWSWEIGSPIPPKGLKLNEHSSYAPFTITKPVDRNSPIFYELLSSGETINGTIDFYRGSDPALRSDTTVYWRVMFSDARISTIEILKGDGDGEAGSIPVEEITFNWEVMNSTWVEEDISYEITRDEIQEDIDQYTVDMYLTIKDLPDKDNDLGAGATVTFKDIPMYEFNHEISQNIDATTGLPTGNSSHSFVQVIKDVDNSSPLLLKALLSGETFECSIRFYRIKAERPSPTDELVLEEYKVITILNASVQSITTLEESMSTTQHKEREHISFCYQKITWSFVDGGITSEDDWESPNV